MRFYKKDEFLDIPYEILSTTSSVLIFHTRIYRINNLDDTAQFITMCKFYIVFCIKFNPNLCCLSPVREEPILPAVIYSNVVLILLRKEHQIYITHTVFKLTVAYTSKQQTSPSLSQVFHSTNGICESALNILHVAHVLKLISCLELTQQ